MSKLGNKLYKSIGKIGNKLQNASSKIGDKTNSIIKKIPDLNNRAIALGNKAIQQSGALTKGRRRRWTFMVAQTECRAAMATSCRTATAVWAW